MSELDQLETLRRGDSTGRLARAAQTAQRPADAAAAVASWLAQTPQMHTPHLRSSHPAGEVPVTLILPPELQPIGAMAVRLAGGATRLADAPLTLGYTPPAALQVGEWAFPATPPVDASAHPAYTLLALLGLLAAARPHMPPWPAPAPALLEALACCHPTVPSADNPAKQIALRLHGRIPCFWGAELEAAAAQAWTAAFLWSAETMALAAHQDELSRLLVMARFPRFWPNAAALVHLVTPDAPASLAAETGRLLARRRFVLLELHAPAGLSLLDRALYWLEMGEWVALYAAALNNVDPAAQVPLEILFGAG